jgi:hypothetical protein
LESFWSSHGQLGLPADNSHSPPTSGLPPQRLLQGGGAHSLLPTQLFLKGRLQLSVPCLSLCRGSSYARHSTVPLPTYPMASWEDQLSWARTVGKLNEMIWGKPSQIRAQVFGTHGHWAIVAPLSFFTLIIWKGGWAEWCWGSILS